MNRTHTDPLPPVRPARKVDFATLILRAKRSLLAGQLERARRAAEAAIAARPDDAAGYAHRGLTSEREGRRLAAFLDLAVAVLLGAGADAAERSLLAGAALRTKQAVLGAPVGLTLAEVDQLEEIFAALQKNRRDVLRALPAQLACVPELAAAVPSLRSTKADASLPA